MEKSKFTDSQNLAVLKQAAAGTAIPALCREQGISTATFYKRRSKYGDEATARLFIGLF
jgi:putative transposase